MGITVAPVTPTFTAEVGDVDLARVSGSDVAAIKDAFWKYAVLIYPDQQLTAQQHIDFARAYGPIEMDRVLDQEPAEPRLHHAFADISNLDE